MRITIEQELTRPDFESVTIGQVVAMNDAGKLDYLIRDAVGAFEAANPDVEVMSPTETKVVLRKSPTPIGISVPTYYLSITTDVFAKQTANS